jgi:adenylylsulfate kinase
LAVPSLFAFLHQEHIVAFTVWLTGLPAAGKSTLGEHIAEGLKELGLQVEVIDSGKLRGTPLGATLGFNRHDRDANVRRHGFAASLLVRHGVVAVVTAISPYRSTRDEVRKELGDFVEVWVSTPKEVCIERDPKGVWNRALAGEIRNFTGVDDPYEPPQDPEVELDMSSQSPRDGADIVIRTLVELGHLGSGSSSDDSAEDDPLTAKLRKLGYIE